MTPFKGFSSQENFIPLPESFLTEVLPALSNGETVKAALYVFWRLIVQPTPALAESALLSPEAQAASGLDAEALRRGLQEAAQKGVFLRLETRPEAFYLLNTPRGRALQAAFQSGEWQPDPQAAHQPHPQARPNIYRLYEENIGPLTPLIADALRDAEATYSPEWIAEAMSEAVQRNIRNWKYIEAILKRWKEEGHVTQKNKRDSSENRFRYFTGKFTDYIES